MQPSVNPAKTKKKRAKNWATLAAPAEQCVRLSELGPRTPIKQQIVWHTLLAYGFDQKSVRAARHVYDRPEPVGLCKCRVSSLKQHVLRFRAAFG